MLVFVMLILIYNNLLKKIVHGFIVENYYILKTNLISLFVIIGRRIIISFFYNVIFFSSLYWFCFWILPYLFKYIPCNIFLKLSILNNNINNILSSGTSVLVGLLTLSVSFYIFIYREQKSSSESAINIVSRSVLITLFIFLSIVTILYGLHFKLYYLDEIDKNKLSEFGYYRINTWVLLYIINLYFAFRLGRDLIRDAKVRFLLDKTIIQVKNLIFQLSLAFKGKNKFFKKYRTEIYDFLHFNIESVYQMFSLCVEKNMNKVFEKNFKEWKKVLSFLHTDPRLIHIDNNIRHVYLLKIDPIEYINLYKSILNNHMSLIFTLLNKSRIEAANDAIECFFNLMPNDIEAYLNDDDDTIVEENYIELITQFITSLHELSDHLYDKHSIGLTELISNIKGNFQILDQSENYAYLNYGFLTVYKALIIKSVEKEDIQNLSKLSYNMIQMINHEKSEEFEDSIEKTERFTSIIRKIGGKTISDVFNKVVIKDNHKYIEEQYLKGCIYILLQSILKGIEISKYSSTGFLIKFIVTNFEDSSLSEVFGKFMENKGINNPYIIRENKYTRINTDLNYNRHTLDYCLKKLGILIFCQQKYVNKKEIKFKYIPKEFINIKLIKNSSEISLHYLNYLIEKVSLAKNKYGLLFLTDKEFMKQIKQELVYNLTLES